MSPRTWKFSAFTFIGILVLFLSFEYSFKTITSNVSENNSRYLSETVDHNTTTTDDDHSTSTEHSTTTSLFGILSHLDPLIGTMSFVIIAAVVVFVETMFHYLNEATHDTPFHQIIPAVEKELMIAGCTAFAFKIIVNAAENMNTDWFHSLEYADLVVPIISFTYCTIGVFLITVSLHQCDVWSKASHLKLVELFDEYFDLVEQGPSTIWSMIYSSTVSEMEFRILQNIFCDIHKIQRKIFPFHEYVEIIFQKFIMEIIEIRIIDWTIVCLLFLLNLIRMATQFSVKRDCDKHDYICEDRSTSQIFLAAGVVLLLANILFAIISRLLVKRIFFSRGITDLDSYLNFLKFTEERKDPIEQMLLLDLDQLKVLAKEAKIKAIETKSEKRSFRFLPDRSRNNLASEKKSSVRYLADSQSMKALAYKALAHDGSSDSDLEEGKGKSISTAPSYAMIHPDVPMDNKDDNDNIGFENEGNVESENNSPAKTLPSQANDNTNSPLPMRGTKRRASVSAELPSSKVSFEFKDTEIHSLFFFGSPWLYFESIQILIMLISLYLALWFTNFVVAARKPILKWLSLLCGLFSAVFYIYIVRVAALLQAVVEIDHDAVMEVVEMTEGSRLIGITIREKILARLKNVTDPESELKRLFKDIDASDNGMLSRDEFKTFLNHLEIDFSSKKWRQIYREIDLNHDHMISFEEFYFFLYPDSGLGRENKRLKIIGQRVKERARLRSDRRKKYMKGGKVPLNFKVLPVNTNTNETS